MVWSGIEPTTSRSRVRRANHSATLPHTYMHHQYRPFSVSRAYLIYTVAFSSLFAFATRMIDISSPTPLPVAAANSTASDSAPKNKQGKQRKNKHSGNRDRSSSSSALQRNWDTSTSSAGPEHWRILGSLINQLTRAKQVAFACWRPRTSLPTLEVRDIVVEDIDNDPLSYPRNVDSIVDVSGFVPALGIHPKPPKHVGIWTASEKEAFEILMRSQKIKALSEVVLDFYARHIGKQREVLRYNIIFWAFADLAKLMIFHLRKPKGKEDEACFRRLELAKKCLDKTQSIQLHCFNGGGDAMFT
ncbi:hypothetical protein ElyMa_004482900 [Elysia marginata]|uniref:PiggyBac transposable element-derived protein domain-containing protein n=1 Tax=Elysia marginata TaxID=1093978 RepID=A0AAV4HM15_9GAST|nr:hypothetical protein ElyMa_004482900 [Elysia marginata]